MYGYIIKFFALLALVVVAISAEHEYSHHHGGHSSGGHGHGHATSSQNYVLHSYHAVPVYYKKSHGHY